ncbi:MAG: GINS complex subunit [Alectoria sarmentosa]|nr:MAG: GINS complex subunit [Alectoria sarmentosa]
MDIDDILAEVDGHAVPRETRDLQEFTRAWVTERSAPEILPWPDALMERILERIRRQSAYKIELVEEQTGNTDPKANFRLIIFQTELERFKFLVRSFLRARIAKIDAHALHHLTDPSTKARLSPSELKYATTHTTLLHAHYRSSFLSQFPASLQRMDDTAGGISMVEGPDVDRAVFVRALKDVEEPIYVEGTDMAFEMRRGDVVVVRWSAVREVVIAGDAELI